MAPLERPPQSPWPRIISLAFLAAMAAVLSTLLWLALSDVPAQSSGPPRKWAVRFALLCAVLLGMTLVLAFWISLRLAGSRLRKPVEHSRTEHVDAWRIAGERMRVPREDEDEPEGPPPDDGKPPT